MFYETSEHLPALDSVLTAGVVAGGPGRRLGLVTTLVGMRVESRLHLTTVAEALTHITFSDTFTAKTNQ